MLKQPIVVGRLQYCFSSDEDNAENLETSHPRAPQLLMGSPASFFATKQSVILVASHPTNFV